MDAGRLKHRVELWGNVKYKNDLLQTDTRPEQIRGIWCDVIPMTGSMSKRDDVETIMSRVSHRLVMRFRSAKDITSDNWFMYMGHRFDIKYIPTLKSDSQEIFVEEVLE